MRGRLCSSAFIIAVFVVMVVVPEELTRVVLATCFMLALLEIIAAWAVNPTCRKWWLPFLEVLVLAFAILVALGIFPMLYKTPEASLAFFGGEGADKNELLFVVIVCALADAGGYAVGTALGDGCHPVQFLAKISPKKSWEGYLGMLAAGMLVGMTLIVVGLVPLVRHNMLFVAYSGILAAIGDLLASACKRALGLKDSGELLMKMPVLGFFERLLAGHGGALDRMDSIAFALMFSALLM